MPTIRTGADFRIRTDTNGNIIRDCGCCPGTCPGPCYCCCPAMNLTVSGFTGDCAALNGTYQMNLYNVTFPESIIGQMCPYYLYYYEPLVQAGTIACSSADSHHGQWEIKFYIGGELAMTAVVPMLRPNELSCFPLGEEFEITSYNLACQPTSALFHFDEYGPETLLLLHCEGADASTTFTDSSQYNASGTPTNAEIDTAQYKVGSASGLFVGNGSVMFPDASEWDLGTGPFCLEGWIRFNSLPTAGQTHLLISKGFSAANGFSLGVTRDGGGTLYLDCWIDGTNYQRAFTFATGTWYHLCANRTSAGTNNLNLYVDGTKLGISETNTDNISNNYDTYVGNGDFTGLDGWVDEIRVSTISRYPEDFTPPTTPYYLETPDSSSNGNFGYLQGDAEIDTTVYKFGPGSITFYGSGYLEIPQIACFDVGAPSTPVYINGNSTYEFNFRFRNLPASGQTATLFKKGSAQNFSVHNDSGTTYIFLQQISHTFAFAISVDTWYHCAIVRYRGFLYLFIDGNFVYQYSSMSDYDNGDPITLGDDFDGWIDEFRFSRVARHLFYPDWSPFLPYYPWYYEWTDGEATFTPPASAFTLDDINCSGQTGTGTTTCQTTPNWECVVKLPYDDRCVDEFGAYSCYPNSWYLTVGGIETCCIKVYQNPTPGLECSIWWVLNLSDFPFGDSLHVPFLACNANQPQWFLTIPNCISVREYIGTDCSEEYFHREFTLDAEILIYPYNGTYKVEIAPSIESVTCNGGGGGVVGSILDVLTAEGSMLTQTGTDPYNCGGSWPGVGLKLGGLGNIVAVPEGCES